MESSKEFTTFLLKKHGKKVCFTNTISIPNLFDGTA